MLNRRGFFKRLGQGAAAVATVILCPKSEAKTEKDNKVSHVCEATSEDIEKIMAEVWSDTAIYGQSYVYMDEKGRLHSINPYGINTVLESKND